VSDGSYRKTVNTLISSGSRRFNTSSKYQRPASNMTPCTCNPCNSVTIYTFRHVKS